jgi:ankyrin repeat protein
MHNAVKLLLQVGANLKISDKYGHTPVDLASSFVIKSILVAASEEREALLFEAERQKQTSNSVTLVMT